MYSRRGKRAEADRHPEAASRSSGQRRAGRLSRVRRWRGSCRVNESAPLDSIDIQLEQLPMLMVPEVRRIAVVLQQIEIDEKR